MSWPIPCMQPVCQVTGFLLLVVVFYPLHLVILQPLSASNKINNNSNNTHHRPFVCLFACLFVCLFVCLLGRRERLGDYHEITLHTLFVSAHALCNSARARDRALAIPLYEEYLLEAGNKLKAAPSVDHHYLHNNNDNSHIQPLLDPTDPRSLYFSLTPWSITDPTHTLRIALDHCAEAVKTLKRTLAGD